MSATNVSSSYHNPIDAGASRILVVIILCLISFFAVVGNSLVCLAMYQQPRLRTVMYLPLFSLAVADLLCGAIAVPAYIAKKFLDGTDGEGLACDTFRFTYFFIEYASISSLVLVSVERMYTLKYPYKIANAQFMRMITVLLFVAWLDALVVALLPFVPWEEAAKGGSCKYRPTKWWSLLVIHKNVFIPFLVVILCYAYIYKVAIVHLRNIEKAGNRQATPSESDHDGGGVRTKVREWRRRRKATSTLFIVVGVFLLCWLPSTVYYYVHNVCQHCFDSFVGERQAIFNAVVKILTFFNSLTNPVIYGWRSREFRSAFRKMFCGKPSSRSISPSASKVVMSSPCASSQVHDTSRE